MLNKSANVSALCHRTYRHDCSPRLADPGVIIKAVRQHTEGLCLPHAVVAREVFNRFGEPAIVMMIGQSEHYYVKTKNFGDIDVFPNYQGELKGVMFDIRLTETMARYLAATINKVAEELEASSCEK